MVTISSSGVPVFLANLAADPDGHLDGTGPDQDGRDKVTSRSSRCRS